MTRATIAARERAAVDLLRALERVTPNGRDYERRAEFEAAYAEHEAARAALEAALASIRAEYRGASESTG